MFRKPLTPLKFGRPFSNTNEVQSVKFSYFGSDGIRGQFGEHPITSAFMRSLGFAISKVLTRSSLLLKCFIAKDGRTSGDAIETALVQGLEEAEAVVTLGGILPSPAVSFHTAQGDFDVGICVTASHNPASHNGVKLFDRNGCKLVDAVQKQIETLLLKADGARSKKTLAAGRAKVAPDAADDYARFCLASLPADIDFSGLKLVLDAANGAAAAIAPNIFAKLGAEVITIGTSPDGDNINEGCGALYPGPLVDKVQQTGALLGIALDGDGDRLLLTDENGVLLDGDDLLFIIATHLKRQGRLAGGVVGTQITNSGLVKAFDDIGIPFARSKIGDRHVLALMQEKGWQLGGEKSGHVIWLDLLPSSDGILTALKVISAWRCDQSVNRLALSQLCRGWQRRPTATLNVVPPDTTDPDAANAAITNTKASLGTDGYVLIRASGTENLIRILVEANEITQAKQAAQELAGIVSKYGFAT